jgi:hypothetical protein
MKSITRAAGALALSGLLASSAFAAEGATIGPLAAGKPAGVKEAALGRPAMLWLGVAVIVGVTIAVVASNNGGNVTPITTGTTGTP